MLVLVLGTGSIGRRHVTNIQAQSTDARFLLVRAGARHDAFSQELNAEVVESVEQALPRAPQLAVIATPSIAHCRPLIALLRAGIPTYVEKPIVATQAQFEELSAALETLPTLPPTLVGCNLRFLPSLQRLRGLLAAGAIGKVARAQLQAGQWLPDWRPQQDYRRSYSADSARGGGVVLDLIHELDMARFLFGEFSRVQAVGGHYTGLEIAAEDAAAILLSRPGGPAVSVGIDYVSRKPVRRYEIVGEGGTLEWDLFARRLFLHRAEGSDEIACGEGGFGMHETYRSAMRQLLEAAKAGVETAEPLSRGMSSMKLALDARAAITP